MENNGENLWADALSLIRAEMTDVAFKTWFINIEAHEEEDTLILFFPSSFNRDIVESRYRELIEKALINVKHAHIKIKYCDANTNRTVMGFNGDLKGSMTERQELKTEMLDFKKRAYELLDRIEMRLDEIEDRLSDLEIITVRNSKDVAQLKTAK